MQETEVLHGGWGGAEQHCGLRAGLLGVLTQTPGDALTHRVAGSVRGDGLVEPRELESPSSPASCLACASMWRL